MWRVSFWEKANQSLLNSIVMKIHSEILWQHDKIPSWTPFHSLFSSLLILWKVRRSEIVFGVRFWPMITIFATLDYWMTIRNQDLWGLYVQQVMKAMFRHELLSWYILRNCLPSECWIVSVELVWCNTNWESLWLLKTRISVIFDLTDSAIDGWW